VAVSLCARARGRVSVVIPTLNEADRLGPLLGTLQGEPGLEEIIVVDGGSADGTPSIAERFGIRLIMSERGRGHQLRAGAAAATGEFLLFLHADSVFPQGG
jgi:glycosyltransferase involved in cell wall biosynthesis